MAHYLQLTRGVRPDGSTDDRVALDASEMAIGYHSVSFLDTYKLYKEKTDNNEDMGGYVYDEEYTELRWIVPEYNTFDRWHLIPSKNPITPISQVSTQYTDYTLINSSLDETEVLKNNNSGLYRQIMSGSFEFMLDHSYLDNFDTFYSWYTDLLETLHGNLKIMIINKDPNKFYIGRFFIESVEDDGSGELVSVTISFNLEPFIYSATSENLAIYYTNGTMVKIQGGD